MTWPDGIWQAAGVLLAVAVVASAIAVHQAQAITAYPVSYATEAETALETRDDLLEDESDTHTFDVDAQNLSSFRIVLEWSDAVGAEDRFDVKVTAPNGSAWDETDSESPLQFDVPVQGVPADHQVYALDVPTARALVPMMPSVAAASGQWTAEVRLASAPGDSGTVGEGIDGAADGEQSYTLTVERLAWYAVIDA